MNLRGRREEHAVNFPDRGCHRVQSPRSWLSRVMAPGARAPSLMSDQRARRDPSVVHAVTRRTRDCPGAGARAGPSAAIHDELFFPTTC